MPPISRHPPHRLGIRGERMAAAYLEGMGWTVLERNFRCGRREIDLVVKREGVLAFVEVKTRAGTHFGHPEDAITALKRREIEFVARHYLARHPHVDADLRFDAVSVVYRRGLRHPLIRHIEDAWRPGWR